MEELLYPTLGDLYDKVDWEGGIYEAISSYGIHHDDVPEEIREEWKKAEEAARVLERVQNRLEKAIED